MPGGGYAVLDAGAGMFLRCCDLPGFCVMPYRRRVSGMPVQRREAEVEMEVNRYYWEYAGDGGVRLLRAFGTTPEVVIPEQIGGLPVTETGAYCFAAQSRLPERYEVSVVREEELQTESDGAGFRSQEELDNLKEKSADDRFLRELCGSYIVSLALPDRVHRIGNFTCYQCTSLRSITCDAGLTEVGSDAFMNCGRLHQIRVRCGSREKSGLRQMLAQLSSEIEVMFLGRGEERSAAAVLFPEYYESYDEIAPAHLFGRNIEGEGFRARQCFSEGVFDYRQYDRIFPQACVGESVDTLCRLALDRLSYPVELAAEAERLYQTYVRDHAAYICRTAVKERRKEQVLFLCENGLADGAAIDEALRLAAEAGWAEGTAYLLGLKRKYIAKKAARYEFEEF